MKLLFLLLVVLIVSAAVVLVVRKKGAPAGDDGPWPFFVKRPLTPVEQVLYHRLVKALPEHIVLAQVQVSRVLGVKKGFKFHEWNNRINRLSYDFVVCSKDSAVLAAIELDDKSHDAADRVETDRKKERATSAAGVRLIRWHAKSLPDQAAIQAAFAGDTLPLPDGRPPLATPAPAAHDTARPTSSAGPRSR